MFKNYADNNYKTYYISILQFHIISCETQKLNSNILRLKHKC